MIDDELRDWQDDAPTWLDGEFWPGASPDERQVSEPDEFDCPDRT